MKYLLPALLIFCLFSCQNNWSNNNDSSIKAGTDTVTKKMADLLYKNISISNVGLGGSADQLNRFGHPDSIVVDNSDFSDGKIKKYFFKKSGFDVDSNHNIYGFDILDTGLMLNIFNIKIGDSTQQVLKKLSKNINTQDALNVAKTDVLRVRIGKSDDYLMFTFKNKILTEYETWSDQ